MAGWSEQELESFRRDIDAVMQLVHKAWDRGWFGLAFVLWVLTMGWELRYRVARWFWGSR